LIPEPPMLVLRSLAAEVGLNEAIVAQQVKWLQDRTPDGWVRKTRAEWRKVFPFWSVRTIERVLDSLVAKDWLDEKPEPGQPTSYRVALDRLAREPLPDCRGHSLKRESTGNRESSTKSQATVSEEPIGFSEWLGDHSQVTGHQVPRAGTKRRADVAASFAARLGDWSLEELKLATRGAHGDEYRRERGYDTVESILRPTKIGSLVDKGRRAAAEPDDPYAAYAASKWGDE
jgi:hypothetical protein